ncbi:jg2658 [Pararge aegeria aegeria]|uniref:Jg2658 protein n=1 Tax=Pararge aegeria aegeria TaxID=348720 RepID=A0A8S4RNQ1_9NEOP|nr:jg2658 [Pararge aegeria aegeria]
MRSFVADDFGARGVSALHRSHPPPLLDDVCPSTPRPHRTPRPAHVSAPTDCIYHPTPPSSYILGIRNTCLPSVVNENRYFIGVPDRFLVNKLSIFT